MISRTESPATDYFGHPLEHDPRCEGCGRSLMGRFGQPVLDAECPSCRDEFKLLAKAGKITDGDGNTVKFYFSDEEG